MKDKKMSNGGKYEAVKFWIKNEIEFNKGLNDIPMSGNDFYERAEAKADALEELLEFIERMDEDNKQND